MLKYVGVALVFLLMITGCTDKGDDQPPVLSIDFIEPLSVEREVCGVIEPAVYVLNDTQSIRVVLNASDDEGLGQYKIDIHANFDCHGHGGLGTIGRPPGQSTTNDWRLLDIQDIQGTSWQETVELSPAGFATAGPYHLSFQVLDGSGNETDPEFFTIYLYNSQDTTPPVVQLDEPSAGDLGTIAKGSVIRFSGTLTDNRSLLDGGNGIVYLVYQDLNSGNYFQGPYDRIRSGDGESYDFSIDFTIPNTLVSSNYRIYLRGIDGVNNPSEAVVFQLSIP